MSSPDIFHPALVHGYVDDAIKATLCADDLPGIIWSKAKFVSIFPIFIALEVLHLHYFVVRTFDLKDLGFLRPTRD